jgi:hypothetical protein
MVHVAVSNLLVTHASPEGTAITDTPVHAPLTSDAFCGVAAIGLTVAAMG